MGAQPMLRQWSAAVNDLFCSLHGHTAKALACFSFAMCLAGHCHSGRLAAAAPAAGAKVASARRRWERLVANGRLDPSRAIGELAAAVARGWRGRPLLLVLDETPAGRGLRCLRLGVAYRRRLLSLGAECYPADAPPLPMPELVCRLLRRTAAALPADARVTLLADRGLSWPAVLDCCRRLGWGHVLRLQRSTRVRPEGGGGRVLAAGDLVTRGGRAWHGRAAIFKKAGWRDARVTAVWDRRCDEPWLLAARADGGPAGLRAAEAYAKRNWCEQTFRDEKGGGFRWDRSRVADPARALRVVLVMALATLLAISLGTWVVKAGRRRDLDPHRSRRLSASNFGLRHLLHAVAAGGDRPAAPPYLPYLHPS